MWGVPNAKLMRQNCDRHRDCLGPNMQSICLGGLSKCFIYRRQVPGILKPHKIEKFDREDLQD